jgi:hypothetical protein
MGVMPFSLNCLLDWSAAYGNPRAHRPPQHERLKAAAVSARVERERREATASVAERVEMNSRANEKKKELKKQEVKTGLGGTCAAIVLRATSPARCICFAWLSVFARCCMRALFTTAPPRRVPLLITTPEPSAHGEGFRGRS